MFVRRPRGPDWSHPCRAATLGVPRIAYAFNKAAEALLFAPHGVGAVQPPQAIADVAIFRFPEGVIIVPKTCGDTVVHHVVEYLVYVGLIGAEIG
jgi:hypothetical protein